MPRLVYVGRLITHEVKERRGGEGGPSGKPSRKTRTYLQEVRHRAGDTLP